MRPETNNLAAWQEWAREEQMDREGAEVLSSEDVEAIFMAGYRLAGQESA